MALYAGEETVRVRLAVKTSSQKQADVLMEPIKKEIEQRDYQDMHRAISPLKKADDAIELDTSNMTLEEVVDQVLTLINKTREE